MGFGKAKHGSKMGRKSIQNRFPEALGRALGVGGPWGAKADLRAILGALEDPFGGLENVGKRS